MKILCFSEDFTNHELTVEFFSFGKKNAINIYDSGVFYRRNTHTNEDQMNRFEKCFEDGIKYYINIHIKGCIMFVILTCFH